MYIVKILKSLIYFNLAHHLLFIVLTTVMVIAGIHQVGGAGHRQSSTRHIPPPTGEIVGNKSWAYELIDPCYQPQYNPHHHSHHQTDSSHSSQNVHTQVLKILLPL